MSEPVIDLLDEVWTSISRLLAELDDTDWDRPTDLPGWTVRDVVSHMIGTEKMLAGHPAPPRPATVGDHVRNPIGEANEAWVEERRGRPGPEVAAEFDAITRERLDQLRALTPDEWDTVGFTPEGEGPYRRFMDIRVFDCWEHEQDIRRATDRPGHLEGPVAAHSVRKVVDALGYIVGKKAAAPDGSSVVFHVSGPIPMVLPVVVEGRARLADEAPPSPDVTLHLDTEAFNALGCGRWSADHALDTGRARIEGDRELGRRVLDSMGFTI